MTDSSDSPGLRRRDLLARMGAVAATTFAAGAGALPAAAVGSWDIRTDVLDHGCKQRLGLLTEMAAQGAVEHELAHPRTPAIATTASRISAGPA